FVTGSTLRHVAVMTGTASVGLMAIFLVEFLSLLYVSRLGRPEATAGVGFATIILFFAVSINIGLMIAASALCARSIGAGDRESARRVAGSSLVISALAGLLISLAALPFLPWVLRLLGASGEAYNVALSFLWIALPSNFLMAIGMVYSGVLRAVGDAKRSMYVTLAGGIITAALDPLLIFWLGLGPDGAAWATVISRLCFAYVGFHGAVRVHQMVAKPTLAHVREDMHKVSGIAGPAIMTNLATPVANAFFVSVIARFGDKAVAATAIIDRLVPLAFGILFALSGAVGPILGQNWGAGRFDRMRRALTDSVIFAAGCVFAAWAVLALFRHEIAQVFSATGLTAELVVFFCLISGPMWLFAGWLFVANAAFNNLGFPLWSTLFSWGRATLGTVPMAAIGAYLAGPKGALVGMALGSVIFGIAALVFAYRAIARLERTAVAAATPDAYRADQAPADTVVQPNSNKANAP
ncbi:MAG: MATE family efflux transporter, partial [Bosea sp. (in: a-proteobacteria)]